MVAVVQTSLSALLNDASALEEATGSEQAALVISLAEARRIVAPRDVPYDSDEDEEEFVGQFPGEAHGHDPNKYAFGVRPGPGLVVTTSPPGGKRAFGASKPGRNSVDDRKAGSSPKAKEDKEATAVFKDETLDEAFKRYDVDGSGFLDYGEASVALADMGALEGVLASKAGELFETFDVDGDGQVDLDEFRELAAKVRDLRGSVNSKPTPEVPEGFFESAAAQPLRKSFAAFAAFGKGNLRVGETVEHVNGRDWAKLVKDCGLVGGSVNAVAADIIFARTVPKGQRVLRWEDGSFLTALAVVAAEHRVTFGQVAQRVSQCAPANADQRVEQAGAGASERAAAAAARAAAETANGAAPGPDATSRAALRSIFAQYAAPGDAGDKKSLGHLSALDALHALSDVGALRRQSPEVCLTLVTRAVDESLGVAPDGRVAFGAFERCAQGLVTARGGSGKSGSYKPPDDIQLPLDQRNALRLSFETFAGTGAGGGMAPEQWETVVRACGLLGAKCSESTAGVIFAKCKSGSGSGSATAKLITPEGFTQALAHVALEYDVKFDVVAQRVVRCTPKEGEGFSGTKKPPKSPVKPKYIEPKTTSGGGGGKVAVVPPNDLAVSEKASAHKTESKLVDPQNHPQNPVKPQTPNPLTLDLGVVVSGSGRPSSADVTAPASPARSAEKSPRSSAASSFTGEKKTPLPPPKEIPLTYRAAGAELRQAFAVFADPPRQDRAEDREARAGAVGEFSLSVHSCDAVKWGQVMRVCNLVGGSLTVDVAREIFRVSGAPLSEDGRMRYDEFLWACATVGGVHGVAFREVANRVVGVANKHSQNLTEKGKGDDAGAGVSAKTKEEKKKKKSMFGSLF